MREEPYDKKTPIISRQLLDTEPPTYTKPTISELGNLAEMTKDYILGSVSASGEDWGW